MQFRPLAGLQGFHLSDFPTCVLLPLCFLSSFLSSPLSPVYRNLCVASLGLILSSITTLLTGWSSSTISLPHLGSAALTLFLLPPDSRAATYAVYWAVICLQPITRSLVAAFPRSFTFGEACIVSQVGYCFLFAISLNLLSPGFTIAGDVRSPPFHSPTLLDTKLHLLCNLICFSRHPRIFARPTQHSCSSAYLLVPPGSSQSGCDPHLPLAAVERHHQD